MTSTIKRHKPKKTTNTVVPAEMQHPYAVQDSVVPGARSLSETIKLLNQKGFSKTVENATVLEVISPPGSQGGKTKYILPHLNMTDGKYLEGYLLKIRLPEDVGSLPDPQDMFGDESTGSRDAFEKKTQNQEQKKIKLINYFEAVANHKTFAPLDPKNTKRPQPNSKVRVYCFSEPHMTAGSSIEGFYEIIDHDDSIFEPGTLNDLLAGFRRFVDEANTIVQSSTSNITSFVAQAFSSESQVSPADLEHEDERGQDFNGQTLADGEMLSENFSLRQLTISRRFPNIDNTPSDQHKENLRLLANDVLEPIRREFGELNITSGYRAPELNKKVGGSRTGDHPRGMAADFVPVSGTKNLLEIVNWIRDNLAFKQLILEMWRPEANRGWIHVSYDRSNNKKEVLEMYKDKNGNEIYKILKKA